MQGVISKTFQPATAYALVVTALLNKTLLRERCQSEATNAVQFLDGNWDPGTLEAMKISWIWCIKGNMLRNLLVSSPVIKNHGLSWYQFWGYHPNSDSLILDRYPGSLPLKKLGLSIQGLVQPVVTSTKGPPADPLIRSFGVLDPTQKWSGTHSNHYPLVN